jgi:serine/threonine protein kinase
MGVVYRALERSSGREVALKVLRNVGTIDAVDLRRFEREAKLPGRLRHPGIVGVLDAGVEGGIPYIALALVKGQPLGSVTLGLRQHVGLLAKVAHALGTAHRSGVIHRDLKPSNVIVEDGTGEPCLVDFGLAFDARLDASRLSRTGEILGTPAYMAPEVLAAKNDPRDPRADVYSLGIMIFECLNGGHPWKGLSAHEVLQRIPHGIPPLPREVDRGLARIVERATSREVGRRQADAEALALELDRWLVSPNKEKAPTSRAAIAAVVGALVLLAAAGVGWAVLGPLPAMVPPPPPAPPPTPPPMAPAPPPPAPVPAPAKAPVHSAKKMPVDREQLVESAIQEAMLTGQLDEELMDTMKSAGVEYPDDSRGAHYGALAALFEEGREVDAHRELVRALTLRPAPSKGIIWRTVFLFRAMGFDLAAAGTFARAEAEKEEVSPTLAHFASFAFLTVEPPYTDPVRAEALCTIAAQARGPQAMMVPLIRAHAVFGKGDVEEAGRVFDGLAEGSRQFAQGDMADVLAERARLCRSGSTRPEWMGRLMVIGIPMGFFRSLDKAEVAWRAVWERPAAEDAASYLDGTGDAEERADRPERAALARLQAARAWNAAENQDRRMVSLRQGFAVAKRGGIDIRALLARAYARALLETDTASAEVVARDAIAPVAQGEIDYRTPDEAADGFLIISEAQFRLGKKKEAAANLKKGLDLAPYDKRPFEALKARLD